MWKMAGANTARRRSRPNAPSSIQNAADVAIAISESISRIAVTGPVIFARAAAGR